MMMVRSADFFSRLSSSKSEWKAWFYKFLCVWVWVPARRRSRCDDETLGATRIYDSKVIGDHQSGIGLFIRVGPQVSKV